MKAYGSYYVKINMKIQHNWEVELWESDKTVIFSL